MATVLGGWAPSDSGPWSTHWDEEERLTHVMPDFGPKHIISILCWCHPVLDVTQPAIAHNVAQ